MDTIDRISRMLKEEKGVTCKPNWLAACIEWERMARNIDHNKLQNLVYEQWLSSDLCVSSVGCLPTTRDNCKLNGSYLLQVNSVIDVGVSSYSQLQKLKGQEIDATDSDKAKKNMEAKPTRMLLLQLTDGLVEIGAMEYHMIPFLSTEISPGVKIKLTGPIECRLGMLLLTSPNVTILGGEVEHLLLTNNQKCILSRAIDKSSNNSTVDRAKPAAAIQCSSSSSVPIIKEKPIVKSQSITTHSSVIDCDFEKNNDHYTHMGHNDVVDELDDLDAAMMDVDLEMFDDDVASENQVGHIEIKNESSVVGVSNAPIEEVSTNRTSSLKTISDILTIVKEKLFHGTLRIKAKMCEVTGKLQYTSDLQWCLSVLVTDDSHEQLSAKLSNEVLEILIGFSAKEFKQEIEPYKSVKQIKNKGIKGFQQCHYALAHLECYMDISLIPNSTPIITRLLDSYYSSI